MARNPRLPDAALIAKAASLCRQLLEDDPHRHMLLISTCQDRKDYVDDSAMLQAIHDALPARLEAAAARAALNIQALEDVIQARLPH